MSGQTTSLSRGATFSFGGVVTATYSDSSTADVTSSTTFSGYDMSTAGTYTVTANYTENGVTKTATYQLTVTKAWSQIWSGSKTISWGTSSSIPSTTYVSIVNPNVSGSQQFRITFTMSFGGSRPSGYSDKYYLNGSQTNSKPGSPQSITIATGSNALKRIGLMCGSSSSGKYLALNYRPYSTPEYNHPGFYLNAYYSAGSSTASGRSLTMTVTKIERYY